MEVTVYMDVAVLQIFFIYRSLILMGKWHWIQSFTDNQVFYISSDIIVACRPIANKHVSMVTTAQQ
jgi:hypothetical protein